MEGGEGSKGFAALTPYLMPDSLRRLKVVNIGDGFILRGIERLVGAIDPSLLWTSRSTPDVATRTRMLASRGVILAGANQMNDRFSVWPGATAAELRSDGWRLIPFGIGLHGIAEHSQGMTAPACEQIEAIHERTEFSSWRCDRTVAYLERHVPALKGRFLMTGCPVVYDRLLLQQSRFSQATSRIAVTVTERGNFWQREASTLDFVARHFPRAERWLVLHQNYDPPRWGEAWRHKLGLGGAGSPSERLRRHARARSYSIIAPADADTALRFYRGIDMHFGSRLHAHLNMISQNKRSWLTHVDERAAGMAETLDFPICDPLNFESYLNFDFERIRYRALKHYGAMQRFLRSIAT